MCSNAPLASGWKAPLASKERRNAPLASAENQNTLVAFSLCRTPPPPPFSSHARHSRFDPKEYIASFPAPPSAAPAADVYEARTKIGSSRGNRAQTAKGMINEIIGEQWGGVGGAAQWALVLDGGDCVTTKSMRRNNAAGTILVPQINPGCVGSISAQTGVESWLGRVEDLVMNPPRVLFDLVFLDHCGTLPPRLWQVKKLLESGRMRKPSVLAVTFSSREGRFMDDEWKDCR